MWIRIFEFYEVEYVPEVLSLYYYHDSQISSDFSRMIPGRTKVIEKHRKRLQKNPDILVIHLKRIGKMHCINGTWKESIFWFKQALKINSFEILKIIAWCIIELPLIRVFSRMKHFKKYPHKEETIGYENSTGWQP